MAVEYPIHADPELFDRHLTRLIKVANELPARLSDVEDLLDGIQLERAVRLLKAAHKQSLSAHLDAAWACLIEASEVLGKLRGWADAGKHFTAQQGVVELLREHGAKGGYMKGKNASAKRDELAKALLKEAPKGGWPSQQKFEEAFHRVAKATPGISGNDGQLRKIMRRPDIRKLLPCGDAERDEVADYIVKAAPKGGWESMERVTRCFDEAAEKVPGFRDSAYQRRRILARQDVRGALSPAVQEMVANISD